MRVTSWALVSFLSVLNACGGSEKGAAVPAASAIPPAEPPPPEKPKEDELPPEAAEKAAADKAKAERASADSTAPAGDADKPATPNADSGDESTARNVKYVVNPEGMRVELEGVSFAPKAEAAKIGSGYGIKLKVDVRAKDGKSHSLLAPTNAEVAFAGSVKRKDGDPEKFGDKREGDREIVLKGDKAVHLTRSWPPPNGPKPIAQGDELELMVGIWGLGEDAASRRPLKKFCKVTLKFEKDKPKVSVTPPDGVSR
ncbi:MAG: hypothetical protein ACOY0T_02390 [Myxococcota bacterium]